DAPVPPSLARDAIIEVRAEGPILSVDSYSTGVEYQAYAWGLLDHRPPHSQRSQGGQPPQLVVCLTMRRDAPQGLAGRGARAVGRA
ncbi:hypothetical protein KI387_030026, partial [Taxus chinensis]